MQKRYFYFMLAAMLLLLPSLTGFFSSGPKIAVVDMQRIMRDSEPAKAGIKFLEDIHTSMQEKIKDIEKRLEKNPKDEEAQKELQAVYMDSQQRIQAEQQNVVTLLYDSLQRVLNSYRERNGYELILNSEVATAFSPALDVTTAVIGDMNKQTIEFKSIFKTTVPAEESKNSGEKAVTPEKGGEAKKQ